MGEGNLPPLLLFRNGIEYARLLKGWLGTFKIPGTTFTSQANLLKVIWQEIPMCSYIFTYRFTAMSVANDYFRLNTGANVARMVTKERTMVTTTTA